MGSSEHSRAEIISAKIRECFFGRAKPNINEGVSVRRYTSPAVLQAKVTHEQVETTLITGCTILQELGVKYWLASGTLLALHRDGQFLPNENEVDIDVCTDVDFYRIFKALPFNDIVRMVTYKNRYMQVALLDPATNAVFDLWFYHPQGARMTCRNDYGCFWYTAAPFDQLGTISYNGKDYPAPDPDWYCEFVYGRDWRTPKSYPGHWTESYIKDCSGFEFTGNEGVEESNYF